MRIAFVPTGRTEWHGLSAAFRTLFPGHEFRVLPTPEEVASHPDDFPIPGFTSSLLRPADEESPPETAFDLLSRAAQAAVGDRGSKPFDMVIVLDDLEIVNASQPGRVTRVFRAAAVRHLQLLGGGRIEERTRAALRDRVSFRRISTPPIRPI